MRPVCVLPLHQPEPDAPRPAIRNSPGILLRPAAILLIVWAGSLPATAAAQPGQLDSSFGNGGKATTNFSNHDIGSAIAIQPDGKIVVVGRTASTGNPASGDFAIARYNVNGTPDASFGAGGKVTTNFFGFDDGATAVAIQADGRIVVAGVASFVGSGDQGQVGRHLGMARYDGAGNLDPSFGSGGRVTMDRFVRPKRFNLTCLFDESLPVLGATGLVVQPDGKYVVSATVFDLFFGGYLAAVRFAPSGSIDTAFAGPNPDWPQCPGPEGVVLRRYFDTVAFGIALQSDGRILLAGNFNDDQQVVLARQLSTGSPDTSFGSGGMATYAPPSHAVTERGSAIAVQPDGKIVVAGSMFRPNFGSSYREALEIKRYRADGTLDPLFGSGGTTETWMVNSGLSGEAVAIDAAGNIVVAGCIETGGESFSFCSYEAGTSSLLIARYNPDGSLNSTFGTGGLAATNFSGFRDGAFGIALQPDGRIVAAGFTTADAAGQENFAVVRVHGGNVTCSYSLAPPATSAGPAQGFGTVGVSTPAGCAWTARSNASWIVVTQGADMVGPGPVTYVFGANPTTSERTGTLTIAGATFTLTQGPASAPVIDDFLVFANFVWQRQAEVAVAPAQFIQFSVTARGNPPPTYQWQVSRDGLNWTVVTNQAPYVIGSTNLTISQLPLAFNRNIYRVVVTNSAGSIASQSVTLRMAVPPASDRYDFDGDGRSDRTVFRPGNGVWYSLFGNGTGRGLEWGVATDVLVPGDYDADGRADVAVYRPAIGHWFILKSRSNHTQWDTYQWGTTGDVPVPADYDGDGRTDLATYRPATGRWSILTSSSGFASGLGFVWGVQNDVPLPEDYDGDGRADLGLYRASTGHWFVLLSTTGYQQWLTYQWGSTGDVPIPGDYDGDRRSDIAVYRPSTGSWYMLKSSTGFSGGAGYAWGANGDVPVRGDFDGDGISDIAVYRPSTAHWFVLKSSSGFTSWDTTQWGQTGDTPVSRLP